jgi:hypothetical protein
MALGPNTKLDLLGAFCGETASLDIFQVGLMTGCTNLTPRGELRVADMDI